MDLSLSALGRRHHFRSKRFTDREDFILRYRDRVGDACCTAIVFASSGTYHMCCIDTGRRRWLVAYFCFPPRLTSEKKEDQCENLQGFLDSSFKGLSKALEMSCKGLVKVFRRSLARK